MMNHHYQTPLQDLPGLGPVSEKMLKPLGILHTEQPREVDTVKAVLELEQLTGKAPSLNLLYAMVGALENQPWQEVVRKERSRLLTELAEARELRNQLHELK